MSKDNYKSKSQFAPRFESLEGRDMMTTGLMAAFAPAAAMPAPTNQSAYVSTPIVNYLASSARQSTAAAPQLTQSQLNWFNANIHDAALRSLVETDFARDHDLTRNDMLGIFREAESNGTVTGAEFTDLKTIANTAGLFGNLTSVEQLSQDVADGNVANAHFRGFPLGNLAANSNAAKLEVLVDKWFLGMDDPSLAAAAGAEISVPAGTRYAYAQGTLFGPGGPKYTDVNQGMLGDCYFLSSLGETALRDPNAIKNMFTDNGDGTFTVRFFNNGLPVYVTVDRYMPVDASGHFIFDGIQQANNSSNVLWVQLAEKAYAQLAELGWSRADANLGYNPVDSTNSFAAISGGFGAPALAQITGQANKEISLMADYQRGGMNAINQDLQLMFNCLQSGYLVCCGSNHNLNVLPGHQYDAAGVVPSHEYAVVGYNSQAHTVTLFNPWGVNNGKAPTYVTLTTAQFVQEFGEIGIAV